VIRLPRPADLAAAVWALCALRAVRAQLAAGELRELRLPAPRRSTLGGRRGVKLVLLARRASCLEGALVRQRFGAACGDVRDVVIGVRNPAETFGAHAWLEGERDGELLGFRVLTRVTLG